MPGRVAYEGKRMNYFTVISREYVRNKQWYFLCKCDCGKKFYATISDIRKRKSCGCMSVELSSKAKTKHGGCGTKIYNTWLRMKSRCYNPNNNDYNDYGGRGIIVCKEWLNNFESFRDWSYANGFEEMESKGRCSIDRIDVNGNYEPSNCRWADRHTQSNNRRDNIYITRNGETHTLSEWAEITGIKYFTLVYRYKLGMNANDILSLKDKRMKGTQIQKQIILEYIESNGRITVEDAMELGIVNLPSRIYDLRKNGFDIKRIYERNINNGKKYAIYFMGGR